MSPRNILLILVAVGLTAATAMAARSWLESQRAQVVTVTAEAPQAPPELQVLVAKQDLPTGSFVKDSDFAWQAWPDNNLPEDYLVKEQFDPSQLIGAVVRRGFNAGEPITELRVITPGDRGFLAVVLNPGFRAVSIEVNARSSIAGLVFPGDRVDILLTQALADPLRPKDPVRHASETVLTNVRILAIDQLIDDQTGEPKLGSTVTLEVTPRQAEMIAVVRPLGELSLSLRPLAKNDEELERLAKQGDPMKEPDPARGNTHTWESDVSRVRRGNGSERIVKVDRGNTTQELRF